MTKNYISIDFETRSATDLRKSGVYAYCEDPSTDVWCAAIGFEGNVTVWSMGQPVPDLIRRAVAEKWEIRAWNAMFERTVWNRVLCHKHGWPRPKTEQFRCTMSEAMAMSLPASLGECAKVLGLAEQKDDEGHRLMLKMCKPRRIEPDGTIVWWDADNLVKRQEAYCAQDVRTETAVGAKLRRLPPEELAVYHLDQKINDFGVQIDSALVRGLKECVTKGKALANADLRQATEGRVTTVMQTAKFVEELQRFDPSITSVAKPSVAALRDNPHTHPQVLALLDIRDRAAKASASKLDALLAFENADGRIRGLFRYHGASTGRATSTGVQLQNLKRGESEFYLRALPFIEKRDAAALEFLFNSPSTTASNLLRSCFVPRKGCILHVADYANIEGRVVMWLAGQQSGIKAFNDYDAGTGADTYKVTYADTFGCSVKDVTKDQRQIGKVITLATGFGGSVGAFSKMAELYHVNLADAAALVKETCDDEEWLYAGRMYREDSGLSREVWTGLKAIVIKWRNANPQVPSLWYELQNAALAAVREQGTVTYAANKRVAFRSHKGVLWLRLPSERLLAYYAPFVKKDAMPWGTEEDPVLKDTVYFWGMKTIAGTTKKVWCSQPLTVPILTENIVQAVARDVMMNALKETNDAGYSTVMHIHDELVAEVPETFGSLDEFQRLMRKAPSWAKGLPIATDGWSGYRYRK